MSQSVCILYGLNEGPATGRQFVAACRRAGFGIVRDPVTADIIFAHSGGCLLVPSKTHAQLITMVGVPYWPGRPWLVCTAIKIWREFRLYRRQHRLKHWAHKWTCYFRYARKFKAGWRMAVSLSPDNPWNSSQHQVIVRNRHDVYCSPHILKLSFRGPRTFISLPGEHDDCWDNPQRYVELVQSLTEDL
jgi:hypothetical protein